MTELPDFFYHVDVHTHVPAPNAIVNITPFGSGDPFMSHCQYYSIGIHPWLAHTATANTIERLRSLAADARIVAIGEAGLDARRGADIKTQLPIFRMQAELAEQVQKPLIIHMVATLQQVLQIKREINPTVPWIIHGFRGKPQQVQELVRHGFYISLGAIYNSEVPAVIPAERLLHETDRT